MSPLNITPLTSPGICFAGIMLWLWLCYGQRGASRWIRQGNALLLRSCIMPQTHVLKESSFWRHQLSFSLELLCTSADTMPGYANPANQILESNIWEFQEWPLRGWHHYSRNLTFLGMLNLRPLGSFVLSLDWACWHMGSPDARSWHSVIYTEASWYHLCRQAWPCRSL